MKAFFQNSLLVFMALAVSAGLIELGLRLVPNQYAMAFRHDSATGLVDLRYQWVGEGFYTLEPNQTGRKQGICHVAEGIKVNAQGFRDGPWTEPKTGFRIALLGDSFTQGLQVGENQTLAARLRKLLGVDVLNAGVGGYSTATEIEAYRRRVRRYRPDLVVLAFFNGNDVSGNSCALGSDRILCGRLVDGKLQIVLKDRPNGGKRGIESDEAKAAPVSAGHEMFERLKGTLRRNLVFYQLLYDVKVAILGLANEVRDEVAPRWRLYLKTEPPEWRDAWQLTEALLATLKAEVEADGSRLAILGIPESFTLNPNWRNEIRFGAGTAVPPDFDPAHPSAVLAKIAQRLDIPLFDLRDELLRYRDKSGLSFPYFAFSCDGHWNPLTHDLAAHALAVFLDRAGFLPAGLASRGHLAAERDRAFGRSPRAILGDAGFEAIYRGGLYRAPAPEDAAQ